ncbi:MAG: RagB/SusD family nutrient uptake outer membrane protein, partial [Cytophagales bacterium]|nr:RagB/SusD family nutrient uptake outer membrane protein [Cytophagales bacterium]
MKNLMIKIVRTVSLLFLLAVPLSCSEDFLDQELPHLVSADDLYIDENGFEIGLNGLYALARTERSGITSTNNPTGSSNNLMSSMMMAGTDIIYANRPWNAERFLNDWGALVLGGDAAIYFREVWEWLYETINTANTLINRGEEFIAGIPGDDADQLARFNRIIAEARTIRAWAYRHLTFLYGDVPMPLEESTGINFRVDWEREPVETIRAQMKEDFEFGIAHLPEDHISNGKIVRAVAQHYLAELLIIEGDFEEAINTALAAINGPKQLVTTRYGVNSSGPGTPFSDMFLDGNSNPSEGNTEALWVFQNGFEVEGGQGHNIM